MITRILFSILAYFLLVTCSAYAQGPIPADELFRNVRISALQFSPNTKWVSAKVLENDGVNYLSLIDIEKLTYIPIFKTREREQLVNYKWISENEVFVLTTSESYGSVAALIDVKGELNDLKVSVHGVALGYVVGLLKDSNKLLYSKATVDARERLYVVTPEELKNSKFDNNLFDKGSSDALSYIYDGDTSQVIRVTSADDKNTIAVFRKGFYDVESTWQLLFKVDLNNEKIIPIKLIDEQRFYVLSDKSTDKVSLQIYNFKIGEFEAVVYEDLHYDLTGANIDSNGDVRYVTMVKNGTTIQKYFEHKEQKLSEDLSSLLSGRTILRQMVSNDKRYEILYVYASDFAGAYYLLDATSRKLFLLDEDFPNLVNYRLEKSKVIKVPTKDGSIIESYLTIAENSNFNNVLLVMPHGGPIGVRDYNGFNAETQFLVSDTDDGEL